MEHLSRTTQHQILNALAERYPRMALAEDVGFEEEAPDWVVNATYLAQQGLIITMHTETPDERYIVFGATITPRGLDLLQDDGGPESISKFVTVRFDADALRALMVARIHASDLPEEEKSRITHRIQEMGTEALKSASSHLVEVALSHWPGALAWLRSLAG